MQQDELLELLKTTGLPVAYHHWVTPPPLPYIVYLFTDSENFGADNKVYQKINNYQVELYSDKKDLASEELIELVFDANDIYYQKSEVYIESEKLYEVLYLITI
jgi:hypothetical protein